MKILILPVCIYFSASVLSTPTFAEINGKEMFLKNLCHTCHGVVGKSLYVNYPNLAGQNSIYIVQQFNDIKNQVRNNGLAILMRAFPMVKTVNAEQIEAIAEYLSQLE